MKKDKKYIDKIRVIAEADIRYGNKNKLKMLMKELVDKEAYEDCQGIQTALNKLNT